jgi:glycosyltransferase involved in cell wall biosynthesis
MLPLPPIRTLFVAMMFHPPMGGSHLRNWQNISIMKQFGPVGVFSIFNRPTAYPDDSELELAQHYNIHDYETPAILLERATRLFRRRGLRLYWAYANVFANALKHTLQKFAPDLVIIEQLWMYPYLRVVQEYGCPVIFDNHNVEAPLYQATHCSSHNRQAWLNQTLYFPQIHRSEQQFIHGANQVWVCSQPDQHLTQNLYGASTPCYVVPNSIDTDFYRDRLPNQPPTALLPSKSRRDLLFLAGFVHPPNAEAAQILIESIFPRLKQRYPDCRLFLVGSKPTPAMDLASKHDPSIIVTGEVPDVRPYLQSASLMLVPLVNGSGTRFKILEAFASQLPVISTAKGAEGLDVQNEKHLLIRNTPEEIMDGICQLWENPTLGQAMTRHGLQVVENHYSWTAVTQQAAIALQSLLSHSNQPAITL